MFTANATGALKLVGEANFKLSSLARRGESDGIVGVRPRAPMRLPIGVGIDIALGLRQLGERVDLSDLDLILWAIVLGLEICFAVSD